MKNFWLCKLKLADYITILNFVSGVLSIFYSIQGLFKVAALLLIFAGLMDRLDGIVARKMGVSNEYGKELDSLSDLVSFGIAPSLFAYLMGIDNTLAIFVLIYFSICGMLRLARFNTLEIKGYLGVPITVNGFLFPLLYFVFGKFNIKVLYFYVLMGILMVSNIKIKKI